MFFFYFWCFALRFCRDDEECQRQMRIHVCTFNIIIFNSENVTANEMDWTGRQERTRRFQISTVWIAPLPQLDYLSLYRAIHATLCRHSFFSNADEHTYHATYSAEFGIALPGTGVYNAARWKKYVYIYIDVCQRHSSRQRTIYECIYCDQFYVLDSFSFRCALDRKNSQLCLPNRPTSRFKIQILDDDNDDNQGECIFHTFIRVS